MNAYLFAAIVSLLLILAGAFTLTAVFLACAGAPVAFTLTALLGAALAGTAAARIALNA